MSHRSPNENGICHSGWLLAGIALAVAGQARAANWEFQPTLEVGEAYTDNVELVSDNDDDWITEVTPGFTLARQATQFQATAAYQLQNLWYANNTDFDDHYHDFHGEAFARSADSSFSIRGTADYDQQNIDPEAAVAFTNLLVTDNRTDAARAQISPSYSGTISDYVDTQLTYSYSLVNFRNTEIERNDVQDSNRHFVQAVFGDLTDPGQVDWQTSYLYSRTEFDSSDGAFEYQRAGGQIGYAINSRTRLLFAGGLESDIKKDVRAGDLDASYWDVGVTWIPNARQSLEARAGERYFGASYFLEWTRRARFTEMRASYTEEAVTTNDQLFILGSIGASGVPLGRIDTDVYIRRLFDGGLRLNFTKNSFDIGAYYDDRDYQITDRNEQVTGITARWTWDLDSRTTLTTFADLEHRNFDDEDNLYRFRVRLERQLSRILKGRIMVGRLVRNTETNTDDYRANGGAVYLTATF